MYSKIALYGKIALLPIRQEVSRTLGGDLLSLAQIRITMIRKKYAKFNQVLRVNTRGQWNSIYTLHFDFQLDLKMKTTFSEIRNVGFYNF